MTWVDCEGAGREPELSLSPTEHVCPACRQFHLVGPDGLIRWHQVVHESSEPCARCGQIPFDDDGQPAGLVWSDELRDGACYPCRDEMRAAAREAAERDSYTGVPRG